MTASRIGLVLERAQERGAVPEGLVQGADLDERHVEEVGPDRVEEGVALLVGHDVDALGRVDRDPVVRVREELQALPVVERVQVVARVRPDRQDALIAEPAPKVCAVVDFPPGLQPDDQGELGLPELEFRRSAGGYLPGFASGWTSNFATSPAG